ncbi:MAG: homoserine dehydrogenase [Calditrichaeota bacterium]|nr:MAG: homoserine dehydrogenase [Calditrichota bacterium]MBL1205505.1 homoserine dehydrogenase [Calditrichota bacterium]NOG45333.1 homoserine dehydrogenase [Calditrichota bacterium]
MSERKKITFALLGFGKLGQGFYKAWMKKKEKIREQTGFELILKRILVKNEHFKRPKEIDKKVFTTDINVILKDRTLKVAIDAIGDIEPTFSIIKKIISRKINIISANRVLLATKMHQLSDLANENEIHFLTEPSLGGGIPVSDILQRDLIANKITELHGIVSGVSNFLLNKMTDNQVSLQSVLRDPDIPKMAESISIVDYEGSDAAMKVAILAATAFGIDISYLHIYAEGISSISLQDIRWADQFGYEIKLLAIMRDHSDCFEARVHPALVRKDHAMISVKGEYNAYYIKTDLLGEYMVYGLGVGTSPTSSLILRDLVEVGNRIYNNPRRQRFQFNWNNKRVLDINEIRTSYYLRFPCVDRPGVMGEVTTIIGTHKINITSAHAETGKYNGKIVGYVHIFLGNTEESEIKAAIEEIKKLQLVQGDIKFFRILEDE